MSTIAHRPYLSEAAWRPKLLPARRTLFDVVLNEEHGAESDTCVEQAGKHRNIASLLRLAERDRQRVRGRTLLTSSDPPVTLDRPVEWGSRGREERRANNGR